jgi:hypothetical protein
MTPERRCQAFIRAAARPRGLRGLAMFRVLAGIALLYQVLVNYAQRRVIWGPNGVLAFDEWRAGLNPMDVNLFALDESVLWFELVYHAVIVVTALWTVGVAPRLTTAAMWWVTWSLHGRNLFVLTGGNNLVQILLAYAMFADLGGGRPAARGRWWTPYLGLLHNAAYLAIVLQVCFVYFTAGVWKVHGERWFFGTALYYALRAPEFLLPGVSEPIYENATLVVLFSYATWIFQIGFPFAIGMRREIRVLTLAIALAFHVSIAVVMGLPVFGVLMIAADLALIGDGDYAWLAGLWQRVHGAWRRCGPIATRPG